MSKTMADHARAYRQRKAAKLARLAVLEEALRKIADMCDKMRHGSDDWFDLVEISARCNAALNHTTEAREEGA